MTRRDARSRLAFYLAVGCVAAAVLMIQVIQTRIISVTSWYHLAFFAISTAMFGMTAAAVQIHLQPDRFAPSLMPLRLTQASLAFAVSTVVSLLLQLSLATGTPASFMSGVAWFALAAVTTVPYFFAGIVISLVLTHPPLPVARIYAADLVGAALGCFGVLLLLDATTGPTAILGTALLPAVAAFLFARSVLNDTPEAVADFSRFGTARWAILVSLLVLCAVNQGTDAIRPVMIKDAIEHSEDILFEKWNSFSRVTVEHTRLSPPALPGPSPKIQTSPVDQRWIEIDGVAGTGIYRFTGDIGSLWFLAHDITSIAYAVPGLKAGAVIGVGGGRDLLTARLLGVEEVVGVEINPAITGLLTERFRDFSTLATYPGVSIETDEARSWFSRTSRTFDVIQMSLVDTWAATGAGAFTLSENGLYTLEAWRMFLDRLRPGGVFTVSRWYSRGDFSETGRVISLAVATLLSRGATEPRDHIFLASAGNVATLVLSRDPLSAPAVEALRSRTLDLGFEILASPGAPAASELLETVLSAKSEAALGEISKSSYLDISPATDSRPFFFNQLKLSAIFDGSLFRRAWQPGVFGGNLVATLTLGMLVAISLLLVVTTIVVPLRSSIKSSGRLLSIAGTAYFALIGMGFMMVEIGLLQRMSVFLGHPTYALSVVLFSLILFTGIGSFVSERFPLSTGARLVGWSILTGVYLGLLPVVLPLLLSGFSASGQTLRIVLCTAIIAPAGFLMGFGFPTGLKLVSAIDPRPIPWFWGINGGAGVLASSIAVLVSIQFGINTTLYVATLMYLLTAVAGLVLYFAARHAPSRALSPSRA